MALLLFASFSSMNFSNLFTLSRICWDEKEVNVMSLLLFFFFEVAGVGWTLTRKEDTIYLLELRCIPLFCSNFLSWVLFGCGQTHINIVNLCLTSYKLDIFCNLRLGDSLPLTQVWPHHPKAWTYIKLKEHNRVIQGCTLGKIIFWGKLIFDNDRKDSKSSPGAQWCRTSVLVSRKS